MLTREAEATSQSKHSYLVKPLQPIESGIIQLCRYAGTPFP
jgi:hypothetical protein